MRLVLLITLIIFTFSCNCITDRDCQGKLAVLDINENNTSIFALQKYDPSNFSIHNSSASSTSYFISSEDRFIEIDIAPMIEYYLILNSGITDTIRAKYIEINEECCSSQAIGELYYNNSLVCTESEVCSGPVIYIERG